MRHETRPVGQYSLLEFFQAVMLISVSESFMIAYNDSEADLKRLIYERIALQEVSHVGTGHRTDWKVVELTGKSRKLTGRLWEYHGRSWKVMETGRVFGLCDHLSACMTWRCLETSRNVSFQHVSAQCLMYIRAHMALS